MVDPQPNQRPITPGPTALQLRLLRLLARGLSQREVAATLLVSERTARRWIQSLMLDVGVHSQVALGAEAVRRGWLSEPDLPGGSSRSDPGDRCLCARGASGIA